MGCNFYEIQGEFSFKTSGRKTYSRAGISVQTDIYYGNWEFGMESQKRELQVRGFRIIYEGLPILPSAVLLIQATMSRILI